MDTLILTILSQNTNDNNSFAAFKTLKKKYPSWKRVLAARTTSIESAIRVAGLAPTKAETIKNALRTISERNGKLSINNLSNLSDDDAMQWLTSMKGIGKKTAAVVLLFAFGKSTLPVDTHVYRVSKRLGLIPERVSRERAQDILSEEVPKTCYYHFHIGMITHGRRVCAARKPLCSECALRRLCPRIGVTSSA